MDIYKTLWGDDTDYDDRALFLIDEIDKVVEVYQGDDPSKYRVLLACKMIESIRREGTKESLLEIEALRKQYDLIYPGLLPAHP